MEHDKQHDIKEYIHKYMNSYEYYELILNNIFLLERNPGSDTIKYEEQMYWMKQEVKRLAPLHRSKRIKNLLDDFEGE